MLKLTIPYDCELITIQQNTEMKYELKEYYTVKNKNFMLDFGTWDNDLKVNNISFYQRRWNFHQAEITVWSSEFMVRTE